MTKPKFLRLDEPLYEYVCAHRTAENGGLLDRLRAETEALGDDARMLISREQGSFLTLFTAAIQAREVIEIGTFTGYSALCLAFGLPSDGRLVCLDQSAEWTAIGRRYWAEAGVQNKIDLRVGPAAGGLAALEADRIFDLAFIDADKTGYDRYYEILLPRMKPGGVMILDNMLAGGKVLAPGADPDAQAIDALNKKLAADERIETVLLPIADGLQVCRKK